MTLKADIHEAFSACHKMRAAIDSLPTQEDLDALVDAASKASGAEGDGRLKDARAEWNRFDGLIGIMREKLAAARAAGA